MDIRCGRKEVAASGNILAAWSLICTGDRLYRRISCDIARSCVYLAGRQAAESIASVFSRLARLLDVLPSLGAFNPAPYINNHYENNDPFFAAPDGAANRTIIRIPREILPH